MRSKTQSIPDHVTAILARSRFDGAKLYLPEDLDRPTYEAVNKVIVGLGGKWHRSMGAHVFAAGKVARDIMLPALATGSFVDEKKAFEVFETPHNLALDMARHNILKDDLVLEPSAGGGRLVQAALALGASRVFAVEVRPEACESLRERYPEKVIVIQGDFLSLSVSAFDGGLFDSCLMNPPFAGNADIRHVTKALSLLRVGATLTAVMSPHWTFAIDEESVTFRKLVKENGSWRKLPPQTFRESGTDVNTTIVKLRR